MKRYRIIYKYVYGKIEGRVYYCHANSEQEAEKRFMHEQRMIAQSSRKRHNLPIITRIEEIAQ